MKAKKIFLFLAVALTSATLYAQTAAEVQMAVNLAKQQGYTDAQIASMASQLAGGSTAASNQASPVAVDRNKADYKVTSQPIADVPTTTSTDGTGIFGHSLFRNKNLNFVPSYNIPTPENYKLSAGDEIVVDIWGDVISNITATINPEGSVNIPNLGPVYIAGQTISKAEKNLKTYLSKIYSGIATDEPTTFVKLALGKTKSVSINIVGDVAQPGSYTLPSLSTIASAMYLAGGPSRLGTVRQIKLYRNNKLKSTLDVYDFILNGKFDSNIRLEDNDVIMVGPYSGVVGLSGAVKRPMKYEIIGGETIADVIGFAGGFADKAYEGSVRVTRVSGNKDQITGAANESFDVPAEQFATFKLQGSDNIHVGSTNDRFKNNVSIGGSVWRAGTYSLTENNSTLKQLIQTAGGLTEDAYLQRGALVRLDEQRFPIHINFNVEDIILGKENITLQPDDAVTIYSIHTLTPKSVVRIYGEVNNPTSRRNYRGESGTDEYKEGMTIADLILLAGGVTDAATLTKVEVARRIEKDMSGEVETIKSDTVAKVMEFNLLKNPADAEFQLKPFDIVVVRRSPNYKAQQSITIQGEVNYPGSYVIEENTVRLSDIVNRAQGFRKEAYIKGAKLVRTLTAEEYQRLRMAYMIAKKQNVGDDEFMDMTIGDSFTIAIDLEKAVANPGSIHDVILRTGDVISVPKLNPTVKITGSVLYPNTVAFVPGKSWKYYLSNAGGVTQNGLKRKAYMVHLNGSVAIKGKSGFKVQPGTEIVIPGREEKTGNGGQTLASILGIASTTASLAAMISTIVNQTK